MAIKSCRGFLPIKAESLGHDSRNPAYGPVVFDTRSLELPVWLADKIIPCALTGIITVPIMKALCRQVHQATTDELEADELSDFCDSALLSLQAETPEPARACLVSSRGAKTAASA